jgi:hypothetical protein
MKHERERVVAPHVRREAETPRIALQFVGSQLAHVVQDIANGRRAVRV